MRPGRATWTPDPALPGYVTDGGLETDLVFHHGVELREFATFPLLVDPKGRDLLADYYAAYAGIAAAAGAGLFLETPTWRANPDWGARLGVGSDGLAEANADAVHFVTALGEQFADDVPAVVVAGLVGPRGDGYVVGDLMDAWQARDYHRPQVRVFADEGVDLVTSLTLTTVAEAVGVALAAHEVGVPVSVGFTVGTDGRLPDGTALGDAVAQVDELAPPDWFVVNCAHPSHVAAGLADAGPWAERIAGTRVNASALQPRRARRRRGARRGRPLDAGRRAGRPRRPAPGPAGRRRVLRHRRPPRRGDVGRPGPAHVARSSHSRGVATLPCSRQRPPATRISHDDSRQTVRPRHRRPAPRELPRRRVPGRCRPGTGSRRRAGAGRCALARPGPGQGRQRPRRGVRRPRGGPGPCVGR